MRYPHHKLIFASLCTAAPALCAANANAANGGNPVAVAQVLSWPVQSVNQLVARAHGGIELAMAAPAAAQAARAALAPSPHSAVHGALSGSGDVSPAVGAVTIDDLLASPPMSMDALVARVTHAAAPDTPAAAAAPAVAAAPAAQPAPTAAPGGVKATLEAKGVARVEIAPAGADAAATASAAAASTKTAAAPAKTATTLAIRETSAGLVLTPKVLTLPKAGATVAIEVDGKAPAGLNLFVRDQKVAELTQIAGGAFKQELKARAKGVTELYVVAKDHMYIVPVTVAEGATPAPGGFDLKVPSALVSLDGVFQGSMQSALYPGLEQASAAPTPAAVRDAQESGGLSAPSLQDSVDETTQAMMRQAHETERFYAERTALNYKAVTIQLIDDRSAPAQGLIYPVGNARVHLVGTEFSAPTDATGHLTIRDVPQRSHFLMRIDDPDGVVRPAVAELTTRDDGGVTRFRVMRTMAFDTFSTIAGVSQNAGLGSYCVTVHDHAGQPVPGAALTVDTTAEGPFYFNAYGFLDRSQVATGPDGRACLFNLQPGPVALTFYQDQAPVATVPITAWAGRHMEDTVDLGREAVLTTRLAAMATAQEQLANDPHAAAALKTIDMIDLIPLGTQDPLMQLGPGYVTSNDPLTVPKGRLRAFAQAAEFEPTIYSYRDGDADSVTPLIPRGFVEDMSYYAQVNRDPSLGTVLAEYAPAEGAARESIALRLVDAYGRDVGDGWYFADTPATKALFFNVPPGAYALLVETKDGYWLGSDVVTVYNETVSYMRMGSQIRYRP